MTLSDEMGNLLPAGFYFNCQVDGLVGVGLKIFCTQLLDLNMGPPASKQLYVKHSLICF